MRICPKHHQKRLTSPTVKKIDCDDGRNMDCGEEINNHYTQDVFDIDMMQRRCRSND